MTSAETAYQEALRRIRAAKASGQHWLDLGDIENLERIPEEIGEFSELRELGLGQKAYDPEQGRWKWDGERYVKYLVNNLSPINRLKKLQTLDATGTCISDLRPLKSLMRCAKILDRQIREKHHEDSEPKTLQQ